MKDYILLNQNDQIKSKKYMFLDNSVEEPNKKSKNHKSIKCIKKEGEKEKIEKDKKKISENKALIKEINEQSNDKILQNENFMVIKQMKLQNTYEKNTSSETELIKLQKKNIHKYYFRNW